jgi:peptidoglycan/LPS O-acetylase OafA/YrhL
MTDPQAEVVPVSKHIAGLDSIRFLMALIVLLSHLGPVPLLLNNTGGVEWFINSALKVIFNGPAAVIVFFVISGFCIHYPFRTGLPVSLGNFYKRRYLRVVLPMMVALLFAFVMRVPYAGFEESILWSLFCEEIYYAIYPLLLAGKKHFGASWDLVIGISFLFSLLVVLINPAAGSYASYGVWLTWLMAFPCWLIGCKLAESSDIVLTQMPASRSRIWAWRVAIWALSVLCLVLRFHSPIGFPWTLNIFSILVFFWLRSELAYLQKNSPLRLFEWAGTWSYSIYLMHIPLLACIAHVVPTSVNPVVIWVLELALALGGCYVFYLAIEKPSHTLARRFRLFQPGSKIIG